MLRDAYSRFVLLYVVCLVLISTVYGQQLPAAQRSWTLTPTTGAILDSVITDQAIYAIDSSYNLHVMSYNGDSRTIAAPTSTQLVNLFRSLPNNDWSFSRREATVAMAVGPNNQVYIAAYPLPTTTRNALVVWQANLTHTVQSNLVILEPRNETFDLFGRALYTDPRLDLFIPDAQTLLVGFKNSAADLPRGFAVSRITIPTMVEERTIFGGAAESIILNCGNNEICVWDTNTTGSIYTLPNLSLSRTFSASVPIAFDPAVLTTADNQQFYLHRNPNNSAIYNLMRRTTSSPAPLASFSLPYTINYANPGGAVVFGYGRDQRGAGSVFAAFTTSTNTTVGRGLSEVIIGHYDCNGGQTDSIVLSTPLLDVLNNAAYVTTASGAANIIVVGTTDGDITNPTSTTASRRAFVSLFRPFTLTETTCFA